MNIDFDISIVGSGPIALTMANLLSKITQKPKRICLFSLTKNMGKNNKKYASSHSVIINNISYNILNNIKIFSEKLKPVYTVNISKNKKYQTNINCKDLNINTVGYSIIYEELIENLKSSIFYSKISKNNSILNNNIFSTSKFVYIKTKKNIFKSYLLILADGLPLYDLTRIYNQKIIFSNISLTNPSIGYAYEFFYNDNIFALLPESINKDQYIFFFCCNQYTYNKLFSLKKNDFLNIVQHYFGENLGFFLDISVNYISYIKLKSQGNLFKDRIISIGNSAQSIHPIAGQGLNLGLRDSFILSKILSIFLLNFQYISNSNLYNLISKYSNNRQSDRWYNILFTDIFSRFFIKKIFFNNLLFDLSLISLSLNFSFSEKVFKLFLYGNN